MLNRIPENIKFDKITASYLDRRFNLLKYGKRLRRGDFGTENPQGNEFYLD